jgi:DNA-binding response OmpR family regulator
MHLSRILFVDDDSDDFELFSDVVKEIDPKAEVVHASSSLHIEKFLKLFLPEIIFLDYNMPEVNGIECLKRIKKNKEFNKVPVIIYSAHYNQIVEFFKNGANAFIEKPFSVYDLKKIIETILRRDWQEESAMKKFELFLQKEEM